MGTGLEITGFSWEGLETFTGLFNAVCLYDGSPKAYSSDSMRQVLEHPSRDPERDIFLATFDGALAGFVHVSAEPRIGRTTASGGVLESFQGHDIEKALLTAAVERAVSLGARVLHVQAGSSDQTAHKLLRSAGFEAAANYWDMRWEAPMPPELGLPDGFTLRPFILGQDEEALTELQNSAFEDTWGFSPNTVREIAASVRLDRCDPAGIVFVQEDSRTAAYCWTTQARNGFGSIGWISMAGARPEYRGKGVGRAAVAAGMAYLKAKSVDGIELEVDAGNVRARELYAKLGFKKTSETLWFERRLDR